MVTNNNDDFERKLNVIASYLEGAISGILKRFTGSFTFNFRDGKLLEWECTRKGKINKN